MAQSKYDLCFSRTMEIVAIAQAFFRQYQPDVTMPVRFLVCGVYQLARK